MSTADDLARRPGPHGRRPGAASSWAAHPGPAARGRLDRAGPQGLPRRPGGRHRGRGPLQPRHLLPVLRLEGGPVRPAGGPGGRRADRAGGRAAGHRRHRRGPSRRCATGSTASPISTSGTARSSAAGPRPSCPATPSASTARPCSAVMTTAMARNIRPPRRSKLDPTVTGLALMMMVERLNYYATTKQVVRQPRRTARHPGRGHHARRCSPETTSGPSRSRVERSSAARPMLTLVSGFGGMCGSKGEVRVTSTTEAVRTPRGRRTTGMAAVVVISALALLAAACGNSSGTKTASTLHHGGTDRHRLGHATRRSTPPACRATEIQVGGVASVSNNPLGSSYGDSFKGVQAYFNMVNAQGGIYGRKLVLSEKLDDQVGQEPGAGRSSCSRTTCSPCCRCRCCSSAGRRRWSTRTSPPSAGPSTASGRARPPSPG